MRRSSVVEWFTLKDIIENYDVAWPVGLDLGIPLMNENKTYLNSLVDDIFNTTTPNTEIVTTEMANTLFCKYIAPRNKGMRVFDIYLLHLEDEGLFESKCEDFFRFFIYILNGSYNKYNTLITNFENEKTKLMDSIKSATETKFNDTPQNVQGTYDWGDDDHLTNITKTENSTELSSKISRLAEIEEKLNNYYVEWANEFNRCFIYE